MLEDLEPTARRVLGGANPLTGVIADELQKSRGVLRAREAGKTVRFVESS